MIDGRADWSCPTADVRDWVRRGRPGSVHCVITSPPYFGQRDYGTGEWEGGDVSCDHNRVADSVKAVATSTLSGGKKTTGHQQEGYKSRCGRCGAFRVDAQMGLEETPDEYVENMVWTFRQVRRLLHPSGTLWLNLGDTYSSSGGHTSIGENSQRHGRASVPHQNAVGQKNNSGLPSKNLLGIPWRVAFALQADGWYLRQWMPWVKRNCLNGLAVLYARTQSGDGPAMLKDLARLDPATVQLWNGRQWTQVVSWTRNEEPDAPLEVEFRNGQVVKCTSNHRWPTNRGVITAGCLEVGDVVPVCKLPEPDEPACPAMIPDWMGWFVGLYLAEGSRSGDCIQIACHADEVVEWSGWLSRVAIRYGGSCRAYRKEGNGATINLHCKLLIAILDTYLYGTSSRDKKLTAACWKRGDGFLRALLSGYLEGDGHYEEANDRWRLGFCRNDALAHDIRTMCARLGASVRIRPTEVSGFGKMHAIYRGSLRWQRPDKSVNSGNFQHAEDGEVVAIRPARWAGTFFDVEVADDPHTFALASGLVTHNSMPDSADDRPGTSCETVFLMTKSPDYFFDMEAVKRTATQPVGQPKLTGQVKRAVLQNLDSSTLGSNQGDETRGFRSGDLWFDSVGMLLAGEPPELLGLDVPVKGLKAAHFAVMPKRLVLPMVLAGTSERGVCPRCWAPWERQVERERVATRPGADTKVTGDGLTDGNRDPQRHITRTRTTGWAPGCECGEPNTVPAVVLDPFTGSGTVGAVARERGRRFVGVELNGEYAAIAHRRIGGVVPGLF